MALAGFLVYANSLSNGFALDDVRLVRDNVAIRSVEPIRIFSEPYWLESAGRSGLYRPITILSLSVNRALTGAGPAGFHLGNVLLHGLVCALAWFAARRAGVHYGTALAAAALFAVHPLHAEVVANIAGRAELLAAAAVLAAWLCHRRAADASGASRLRASATAAGAYLVALLSKEGSVLAPALFLLDDVLRRRERARFARAPYAGYAVALGIVGALRFSVLGGLGSVESFAFLDNPAAATGSVTRIATALWVLARYAWLFVWPARLSSDYSYDAIPVVEGPGDPRLWAGLAVVAATLGLAVYGWLRSRPLCLGAAIAALFLLPASNLPFAIGTVMAERLTYLPSLGGCLVVGHGAAWLASTGVGRSRTRPLAATLLVLVASTALAARTVVRNPQWTDNLTLALHDAEVWPRSAKLQAGVGIALHADGALAEAEARYRRALEIYPEYAQIHYNLGELLLATDRADEGVEHLLRAADISPGNPQPFKSLARAFGRIGRREEALQAFARGVELDPSDYRFRFEHARALLSADRWDRAMERFAALAADDPGGVWGGVSTVLVRDWQGRTAEALELCRTLLARDDLTAATRSEIEKLAGALERRGAGGRSSER